MQLIQSSLEASILHTFAGTPVVSSRQNYTTLKVDMAHTYSMGATKPALWHTEIEDKIVQGLICIAKRCEICYMTYYSSGSEFGVTGK